MLSELYSEDEDPWALRQHQGSCCNNFIIRLMKFILLRFNSDIAYVK